MSKYDECVHEVIRHLIDVEGCAKDVVCDSPPCSCAETIFSGVLATLKSPNEAMLMAAGRECGKIEPDRLRRFGIPIQAVQAMLDAVEPEEG